MNIITCFLRSISIKHVNYLLKCTTLTEKYDDISFSKEEVISSLEKVRIETEKLDKDNILDNLNNEFIGIGLLFIDNAFSEYNNTHVLYPKEGIVTSEYKPNRRITYIYVNDDFINNFINKNYEILSNGILATSIHEDTHKQQLNHSNNKVKGLDSNVDINSKSGFQKYLEKTEEIDAHAREVALYLYNLGYSGSQIGQMLNKNDPELMKSSSYEKYWNFFGIITTLKNVNKLKDKDSIRRLKVWKRFLSKIVAYLITTAKYKFTVKYEDALKRLKTIENEIGA